MMNVEEDSMEGEDVEFVAPPKQSLRHRSAREYADDFCQENDKEMAFVMNKIAKGLIDINTSSLRKLVRLQGIGEKLAQRIIDHRPYYSIDELLKVPGIGISKLLKFEHQLAPIESAEVLAQHVEKLQMQQQKPHDDVILTDGPALTSMVNPMEVSSSIQECLETQWPDQIYCDQFPIVLGSWNIRHLSNKKKMPQLERICEIIQEFDILALQEVRDLTVLKRMKAVLRGYDFIASGLVGRGLRNEHQTNVHEEIYAFFYRRSTVRLRGRPALLQDPDDMFVREPFIAQFQCHSSEFQKLELVLVNIHVIFGKAIDRKAEVLQIKRAAKRIDKRCRGRGHVVLLGDFNTDPVHCSLDNRLPLIRQPMSTTIYGSLYDNIWLPISPHLGQWEVACGVYRTDWKYFPQTAMYSYDDDEAKIARKLCNVELSDHCPIWVAFYPMSSLSPASRAYSENSSIRLSNLEHRAYSSESLRSIGQQFS